MQHTDLLVTDESDDEGGKKSAGDIKRDSTVSTPPSRLLSDDPGQQILARFQADNFACLGKLEALANKVMDNAEVSVGERNNSPLSFKNIRMNKETLVNSLEVLLSQKQSASRTASLPGHFTTYLTLTFEMIRVLKTYKRHTEDKLLRTVCDKYIYIYKKTFNEISMLIKDAKDNPHYKYPANGNKYALYDIDLSLKNSGDKKNKPKSSTDLIYKQADTAFKRYLDSYKRGVLGEGFQQSFAQRMKIRAQIRCIQKMLGNGSDFAQWANGGGLSTPDDSEEDTSSRLATIEKVIKELENTLKRNELTKEQHMALQDTLARLRAAYFNIENAWILYNTPYKDHTGKYGMINPHLLFNDMPEDTTKKIIDHCNNKIKAIQKASDDEAKKVWDSKPPVHNASWLDKKLAPNNNNPGSPAANSNFRTKVKKLLISNKEQQPDAHRPVLTVKRFNKYKNEIFTQYPSSENSLRSLTAQGLKIYRNQANKNNLYQTYLDTRIVQTQENSLSKQQERYDISKFAHNFSIYQFAKKELESFYTKICQKMSFVSNTDLLPRWMRDMMVKFSDLINKKPPKAEDYVTFLGELAGGFEKYFSNPPTIRLYHNRCYHILSHLVYNLVNSHIATKDACTLTFTKEQLEQVSLVVRAVLISNTNRPAKQDDANQLVHRIEKRTEQLTVPGKSESKASDAKKEAGYRHGVDSTHKLNLYRNTLIQKLTSHTIAEYAISTGRVTPSASDLAWGASKAVNAIADKVYVPGLAAVGGIITALDAQLQQDAADDTIQHMRFLQWIAFIENTLAATFCEMFEKQIINMKSDSDIKKFAERCQKRVFSALKLLDAQTKQDNEKLLESLVLGLFIQTDNANPFPFFKSHLQNLFEVPIEDKNGKRYSHFANVEVDDKDIHPDLKDQAEWSRALAKKHGPVVIKNPVLAKMVAENTNREPPRESKNKIASLGQ